MRLLHQNKCRDCDILIESLKIRMIGNSTLENNIDQLVVDSVIVFYTSDN